MKTKIFYGKIVLVLVFSFLISKLLLNEIFIIQTPKIRPNLGYYLIAKVSNVLKVGTKTLISFFIKEKTPETDDMLKDVPLRPIVKGVYGKSRGNYSYTLIKTNEIEWVEYTFNIHGKTMKLKVPKGQNPPSQKMLEQIYASST
jgi:hypothetical protein